MKKTILSGALIVLLLLTILPAHGIEAARGVPGSAEFGYGAWLHLHGKEVERGLRLVRDLGLDWVGIQLNWEQTMPVRDAAPDVALLDRAMENCAANQCAVLISLTNPPSWAMTPSGPDAEITAQWVDWLAGRYPEVLQAVELYPGANQFSGWKAAPDPRVYAQVYQHVKNRMRDNNRELVLVAGGLVAGDPVVGSPDWTDLDFIQSLYESGARTWLDVLSIQLSNLNGDPLQAPGENNVLHLRHYERIRQIMLANDHSAGMIWITLIDPPDGTINSGEGALLTPQKQAEWLQQALVQIRSQLYMGATLIPNLNPPAPEDQKFGSISILVDGSSYHPFYSAYKAIIKQTNPNQSGDQPGRPKSSIIMKCLHKKG